jgi:hypothetical protein
MKITLARAFDFNQFICNYLKSAEMIENPIADDLRDKMERLRFQIAEDNGRLHDLDISGISVDKLLSPTAQQIYLTAISRFIVQNTNGKRYYAASQEKRAGLCIEKEWI